MMKGSKQALGKASFYPLIKLNLIFLIKKIFSHVMKIQTLMPLRIAQKLWSSKSRKKEKYTLVLRQMLLKTEFKELE